MNKEEYLTRLQYCLSQLPPVEAQNTMQYYKAGETVTIKYYHPEGTQYVLKSVDVTLGKKN